MRGRTTILCSLFLALVMVACTFVFTDPAAAASAADLSLRLAGFSTAVREIGLETSSVSGAASASLERDGSVVISRDITGLAAGQPIRFEHVALPSSQSVFAVSFRGPGGDVLAQTPPLAVEASRFVPGPPKVDLKRNSVVGSAPTVRGRRDAKTATVTVSVNGADAGAQGVPAAGEGFAVQLAKMPYQSSTLVVRAMNAWGTAQSESYQVWNLGRTLRRATYIVVDKSECRLYFVKNGAFVKRYSVAVGTPRTPTPTGEFVITKKHKGGSRYRGLGAYWLRLEQVTKRGLRFRGYFIHGTAWRRIIGMPGSLGCVDMLNSEIRRFGPTVPLRTHVLIRK